MDFNLVLSGLRKGLVASLLLFTTTQNGFASAPSSAASSVADDDIVDDGAAEADVLTFNLTQATPFGTITVDYDGKKSKVNFENTHAIQQAELDAEDGSKISYNELYSLDDAVSMASSYGLFDIPGAHIDLSPLVKILMNPALEADRQDALKKYCAKNVDNMADAVEKSLKDAESKAQAISDRLAKEQEEREAEEAALAESGAAAEKTEVEKLSAQLAALLAVEDDSQNDGDSGDAADNQGASSSAAAGDDKEKDPVDAPAGDDDAL